MFPNHKKQTGISIIAAIFLMVILALMGAGMVSLLATSQQSISHEITALKAYMTARTCLQWSMYQMTYGPAAPAPVGTPDDHISTSNFTDQTSNLYNTSCTIDTDIIKIESTKKPKLLYFYNLNVEGRYGGVASPEYSVRSLRSQYELEGP